MHVILVIINLTFLLLWLEKLKEVNKLTRSLDLVIKRYSEAIAAKEVLPEVAEKIPVVLFDYNIIFKALLLVVVVYVAYKSCSFVSETSDRLTELVDNDTSVALSLDYLLDSKVVTKFVDSSTGYEAILTRHDDTCQILFRDPVDNHLRSLSDFLGKVVCEDPRVIEETTSLVLPGVLETALVLPSVLPPFDCLLGV
jgi:hypothetical protein